VLNHTAVILPSSFFLLHCLAGETAGAMTANKRVKNEYGRRKNAIDPIMMPPS
jgi:hypothetical protein